jgi:magnesium-protoporphyrin IX monomethyl ester (oxidative) cyclase
MTSSVMDICFVSLPFTPIERPMISFGLLQSILKKENIKVTTLYYNLDFAEKIGAKNYHVMSQFAYVLFGEWVFSKCLFPDKVSSDDYISNMHDLLQYSKIKPSPLFNDRDYLLQLRNNAHIFLKETAEEVIRKYNPKIVACSSIFDNHIACVSVLKFIKEQSPETVTIIGGQNCEGEMGKTTHKLFPFVDYVVSGYADHLITELCNKIFTYGQDMPAAEVPNQVIAPIFRDRKYNYTNEHMESKNSINLNELPIPDYDDYFKKLYNSADLKHNIIPGIPIESSRGCWWSKCKFCGLKQRLSYMKKDWEQVYNEIVTLAADHKTRKFMFCDNNVPFNKLSGMLDKLTEDHLDLHMWAEIRVEIKKEQLKKMKEAGVTFIQVGIESMNDNFLNCMNKGSTMLQNIQVIKWAQQYGMFIIYTIMHSFPNEKNKWFRELSHILPLLVHLQPPRGMTKLRFDRFSDYYLNPSNYGLDLSALEIYSHIYPYGQSTINNFAYFFEDKKEYRMRKKPILQHLFGKSKGNFNRVKNIVTGWMNSYYSANPVKLNYEFSENNILINDTRPVSFANNYVLNELEGEIFLLCDEVQSIEEINNKLGSKYKITEIDNSILSLINKKIVLKHETMLLTLAVEAPLPSLPEGIDFPCGTVLKEI